MSTPLRIAIIIICDIALFYLIIRAYLRGEDTLMGVIIGIIGFICLFVIVPILDFFLNDTDSIIAMLIAFGFEMFMEASYRAHQVRKLKREIRND